MGQAVEIVINGEMKQFQLGVYVGSDVPPGIFIPADYSFPANAVAWFAIA